MAGLSKGTAAEAMSMKPQLERRGQGHCRCEAHGDPITGLLLFPEMRCR